MTPKFDRWPEGYVTALPAKKYLYQQIIKPVAAENGNLWLLSISHGYI